MRKVELLSPVGNREMLYQAIHNGADAVYLAGVHYGARKFATNFDDEEMVEAIRYAHLYGVKVYVTVNTLMYETEMDGVLKFLDFLHKNGVDAVIMQDIGLIQITRKVYPNLEIHASTQAHNYNQEGLKLWKELGVKRVVLAREVSLQEIKQIDVDIEKEIFVYGALCVCYSGNCLFSSLNGGRSGNRGECVGSCRLPYKLIKNNEVVATEGNYLLSTKELNTLGVIQELLESGVNSFKIEGRMKSPAYVGYVTRLYRTLIDKYQNHEEPILTSLELMNLKKLFNREFTTGYLCGEKDIMNIKTPNHQGVEIGYVMGWNKYQIKVKLTGDDLRQNDGIRFQKQDKGMNVNRLYNDKGLLVHEVLKGDICFLDKRFEVKEGEIVLKTVDSDLEQKLANITYKKIPISMKVKCFVDLPMELTITDGIYTKRVVGDVIEVAKSHEVDREQIIKQLSKLGNTPFVLEGVEIQKDDNIFISLKVLNQMRREAVELLIQERVKHQVIYQKNLLQESYDSVPSHDEIYLHVLVRNEEQLVVCLEEGVHSIYVTDYSLYQKYRECDNVYYRLDRVMIDYPDFQNERLLVGDFGSVYRYHDNNTLVGDYYLNVTNHYSIQFLNDYDVKRVTLSVELEDSEIKEIMKYEYPVEKIIYGRLELMIMKYCPLKKNLNYCCQCKSKKDKFYLEDKWNNRYPIESSNCFTHILHYKVMSKIERIKAYREMGIRDYRIELWDETKEEVRECIRRVKKSLEL